MTEGQIVKNTGSCYWVKTKTGEVYPCRIKGKFRTQNIKSTNPLAIGDFVSFTQGQDFGLIHTILKRKNQVVRKSINLSKQSHIIAANVDQALLVCTISHPNTSFTFIDRFLASCEAYSIPTILAFNKTDLYSAQEKVQLDEIMEYYSSIGYTCVVASALTGEGVEDVINLLEDKLTLFSGHSGVGKSSLLNRISPSLHLKVGEISDYHSTGKHTTTYSEIFEVPSSNTRIIDTPGIKGFGTFDLKPKEAYHYFREIFETSQYCNFHNCTHLHEPKCAVKEAVEKGHITSWRYESYLSIILEDEEKRYR